MPSWPERAFPGNFPSQTLVFRKSFGVSMALVAGTVSTLGIAGWFLSASNLLLLKQTVFEFERYKDTLRALWVIFDILIRVWLWDTFCGH